MNRLPSLRTLTSLARLALGSLLLFSACQPQTVPPDDPDGPIDTPTGGKAGYVIGTVTDPQGRPLAGATIYSYNTVVKDRGSEVTSNADGSYRIALVSGLGVWGAKGYLLKTYNGRVYKLPLDPENPDSFTEDEKPVRNFQWRLSGHVPDLSLDLYYGGTVELLRDANADGLRDNENIEFTFTPVGPLIDGSTGQTLKLRAAKRYDAYLKDVPMGRYTVTAVYKPTGEALRVGDALADDMAYSPSVTVDFTGRESSYYANMMRIRFTNR